MVTKKNKLLTKELTRLRLTTKKLHWHKVKKTVSYICKD